MVNRSDRTAIGATAQIGGGPGDLRRVALEFRHRRWLTDRIALDLGAGPLEINDRKSFVPFQRGAAYGAAAHAGLVLMDLTTLTTSVDLVHGGSTQLTLSAGGRLGSYATIGSALVVGGLGALVGAALRD